MLNTEKQTKQLSVTTLVTFILFSPILGFAEDHSHHHVDMSAGLTRNVVEYKIPEIKLVRADGVPVTFLSDVNDGKPVFVNFIYTTCTAICPVMTHTFSEFEKKLGVDKHKVHLVSVSIDPEQDTPKRLREYSKQYDAGKNWIFYTGTLDASIAVQKIFSVYRGDKMNHFPVTLIRTDPNQPWIRLEGFATPDDLLNEYKKIASTK